jgi:DNA-binding response OmpR family regulator
VRQTVEEDGFDVRAETGDAASAVEAALRERSDVCLLEVKLPEGGLAGRLRSERIPETAVIMLTASTEDSDSLLRSGPEPSATS